MKKIGILTGFDTDKDSVSLHRHYFEFAAQFGEPILLTIFSSIQTDLDLIILIGGADVNPERYGQRPDLLTGRPDLYKEYFDLHHLPKYKELNIPIFGICRGHQSFAVSMGYQLLQHIDTEVSEYLPGEVNEVAQIEPSICDLLGLELDGYEDGFDESGNEMDINSRHHQSVMTIGMSDEDVIVAAVEKEVLNVEALVYRKYPAITVQWHPEVINDEFSLKAIKFLLEHGKKDYTNMIATVGELQTVAEDGNE